MGNTILLHFKNEFQLKRNPIQKTSKILSLLLFLYMPLATYHWHLSYIIAALVLIWIFENQFMQKFTIQNIRDRFLLFVLLEFFFVLHIIYLIHTEEINRGIFDIEVKLSFLIFPIIYIFSNQLIKEKVKLILSFFVLGTLIACLLSIIVAFYHSISFVNNHLVFNHELSETLVDLNSIKSSHFFYTNFSLFMHPTYSTIFITLAMAASFYLIRTTSHNQIIHKLLFVFLIFTFTISTYFLQSKAGYIGYTIVLFYNLSLLLQPKFRILFTLFPIIIIILLLTNSSINRRFFYTNKAIMNGKEILELAKSEKYNDIVDKYAIYRIPVWFISYDLFKENFLFGVGTGDIRKELTKKYAELGFRITKNSYLNCHNQYLETALGLGLFGIIVLIFIFLYLFYYSICNINRLVMSYIITFSINFLFESILNISVGIIFFVSFICLIYKNTDEKKILNKSTTI